MAFEQSDDEVPTPQVFGEWDESTQCKEVYAHFGLSAYVAQCLEVELTNATLLLRRSRGEFPSLKDWDEADAVLTKKTLGGLIKSYRSVVEVSEQEEAILAAALDARNTLIHGFFYDHAAGFMQEQGRLHMIRELFQLRSDMVAAHNPLEAITSRLAEKFGVTKEVIALMEAQLDEEARKRYGA